MESFIDASFDVTTTRFNSQTYKELCDFKERTNYKGSLYNTSVRMSETISPDKYLIVLEMNNTRNKIMGLGLIKNKVYKDTRFKDIYEDEQLNRNTYRSKFHVNFYEGGGIDAENILEEWEKKYIEEEFERRIFYGKANMKRGHSFTRVPRKWLTQRHKVFLVELFKKYCPKVNSILEHTEEKSKQ